MTLLRTAARTLLASYFVTSGVKAVRSPDLLVPAAQPVADKLVPFVKQYAPASVAGVLPEDTKTLVRVNGAVQVLGGLALASGKGRRSGALLLAGSLIPSTIAKYPFWSITAPEEKAQARAHFSKNLSLLGGVLLAAVDTEGKPSLVWRAQKGGQLLAKDTRRATKRLSRTTGLATGVLAKNASGIADSVSDIAGSVGKTTSQFTDNAYAGGAALVGAAVASSRKTKKQAAAQLKAAREAAAQQAAAAQKEAAKRAKAAKKDQAKQNKAADRQAAKQAVLDQKDQAKQAVLDGKAQAKQAALAAREQAKQAVVEQKQQAKQALIDEKQLKKQNLAAEKEQAKRDLAAEKQLVKQNLAAEKQAAKANRHITVGEN